MSALDGFVNGENGQAEACLMDINVTPDKYTAIEDAIYRIRNHEHTFGAMSAENLASLMEKELLALRARIAELEAENGVLRKMHKEAIAWGDKGWGSSDAFQLENVRLKKRIKDLESDVFYGGKE